MPYTLQCATIGALSNIVSCFDGMNQLVSLDIGPSGLKVQSVDHDGTTVLTYTLPLDGYGYHAKVYVKCEQVIQYLERVHGNVCIEIDEGSWSLCDATGHACMWPTGISQPIPNMPSLVVDSHNCLVSIPSVDFLLYVQHITLCENYVRVSSHGMNDVTLESQGELVSIQIQNQSVISTGLPYTLNCTFKYIRAVLSIIQKTEILDVFIIHGKCLFFKVNGASGTMSVVLKDTTSP